MGTGAVIIGLSAQAFMWSLIAAVILLAIRSAVRAKRVGWICWGAAVLASSIFHGIVMFAAPDYANSLIGELLTSIRIFVVPLVLLAVFLGFFSQVSKVSK